MKDAVSSLIYIIAHESLKKTECPQGQHTGLEVGEQLPWGYILTSSPRFAVRLGREGGGAAGGLKAGVACLASAGV